MRKSIDAFISYADADENLCDEFTKHISSLRRMGFIADWHRRSIMPGKDMQAAINHQMARAGIIFLLISADFLASAYCVDVEMAFALQRHRTGEALVLPIIVRPCDWHGAPFSALQALPRDGRPVTTWASRDEGWSDVVQGIRLAIDRLKPAEDASGTPSLKGDPDPVPIGPHQLYEVFLKSGVPTVTFVEPREFHLINLALAQPGRGVVIEGPSGIGKTTAIRKAIERLVLKPRGPRSPRKSPPMELLTARKSKDLERLEALEEWHQGTVVVDDFHRLPRRIADQLVDYLKSLADSESGRKKLVIVGIPRTGESLVDVSFDVATRIDVFRFDKVDDDLVSHMIDLGENALNISFDRKADIVLAASGSLNVAQFLCFHICASSRDPKIVTTLPRRQVISSDVESAISNVMIDLSRKFDEPLRCFAALGAPHDSTTVGLLGQLTASADGFVSLRQVADSQPDLAPGIDIFIRDRWMDSLYRDAPTCESLIFFREQVPALVVDDPQLMFYLRRMSLPKLARDAGKASRSARKRVFVSYSHADANWLKRLRVHLKPLARDGLLDLWDDSRIRPGMRWREEIQDAMNSATVAILLVSADFLASPFIADYEIPHFLKRAHEGGTLVLVVILSPCLLERSPLMEFQAVNDPSRPLSGLTRAEQENACAHCRGRRRREREKLSFDATAVQLSNEPDGASRRGLLQRWA